MNWGIDRQQDSKNDSVRVWNRLALQRMLCRTSIRVIEFGAPREGRALLSVTHWNVCLQQTVMDDRSIESHVALPVESAVNRHCLVDSCDGNGRVIICFLIFLRLLIIRLSSILSTLNIFIILNCLNNLQSSGKKWPEGHVTLMVFFLGNWFKIKCHHRTER